MSGTNHLRSALIGGVAALALVAAMPRAAATHSCISNWCSGSDGSTANNIQGNDPQVYIGQVGSYQHSFYGVNGPCPTSPYAGMCWSTSGADGAVSRYNSNTGIGVEGYYFGGGPGKNNQGLSAYCFGAKQGYDAAWAMNNKFGSYEIYQYMQAIDIESPISDYGWSTTTQARDRDVFNGFFDYMAGKSPCGDGSNAADFSQPIIYSSPNAWGDAMGSYGSIPNTPEWSYEQCCESYWPGSNWGGLFESFGGTNWPWALQFHQNADYNDAVEPQYMPVFGFNLGS